MEQPASTCKSCGRPGHDKYCGHCGQPMHVKKITFSYLVHEVVHFFTHLDKGIGYTLKRLIATPGAMQRQFLAGDRIRYQKPFSMFFICATVVALVLYWINLTIVKYYHAGDSGEVLFFNKYMVLLLLAMVPVSTLITYVLFFRSGYGFAEIGVMQLYTISVFLLIVMFIQLLKFIWPHMETRFIELPLIVLYNLFTFIHFFRHQNKWIVGIKSVLAAALFFLAIAYLQDTIVDTYLN
jgi:hypothetical protein